MQFDALGGNIRRLAGPNAKLPETPEKPSAPISTEAVTP